MRSFRWFSGALAAAFAFLGAAASAQELVPQPPEIVAGPENAADESGAPGIPVAADAFGGPRALTAEDADIWLDGFMSYALPNGDIAGAIVVIVQDGRIVTQRGFGFADIESRTPVDPQRTLFRPGSVSKLITWTAVMQQVEQGRIDLDADINEYLDFKIPDRKGEPVTMRQIMTHTAGFEEQVKQLINHEGDDFPSYDELLKRWTPKRIFAPGTTPAYSNYATSLAGYIVERVSGEPFVDYVDAHIFEPLGMNDSTFAQPLPEEMSERMSTGYNRASGKPVPFELGGPIPAGSMSSTAEDMARFMIAHLNEGELNGNRILKAETAREMHTSATTIIPPLDRMLLGFFETDINGRDVIAHLGDTKAFHSALHLFLDENTGLYVSVNSGGRGGAANNVRISLFEQFADRYFPGDGARPQQGVSDEEAAEHARMMAGNWIGSRRADSTFLNISQLLGQIKVEAGADGELIMPQGVLLTGRPADWVEIEPFVWQDRNSHFKLAAVVEDGEVKRFSTSFLSAFTVFERPVWYKNSALLMPLAYAALIILFATAVLWPVRAVARLRMKSGFPLTGRGLVAYRLSRVAALLVLLLLGAWMVAFNAVFASLGAGADGIILTMQVLSFVVLFGQIAVFAWYAWQAWTGGHGWSGKIWSLALLFAGAVILWIGLAFHLIGYGANF